jgi:hypothetical protein
MFLPLAIVQNNMKLVGNEELLKQFGMQVE